MTTKCAHCGKEFSYPAKQKNRRFCGHKCAFAVIGGKVRAAAAQPEALKKNADGRRGRGAGKGYIKRDGRHEHRIIAERKIGRPLRPGEVVHHGPAGKRVNTEDNLEVLTNQGLHARLHFKGTKRTPRTVCAKGHALTAQNTRITSIGRRRCLTCAREYDKNWKKERRNNREATA